MYRCIVKERLLPSQVSFSNHANDLSSLGLSRVNDIHGSLHNTSNTVHSEGITGVDNTYYAPLSSSNNFLQSSRNQLQYTTMRCMSAPVSHIYMYIHIYMILKQTNSRLSYLYCPSPTKNRIKIR